jgi:methyl-accepting chemotaxis protein
MPDNKTYEEILATATAAKEGFQKRERDINAEINGIKAASSTLSAADKTRISDLREEKKALLKAIGVLGLETAEALDDTDKARNLVSALRGVRQELEARREKLLRIAEAVQKFGNTLKTISQIAEKLDGIASKLDGLTS